MLVFFGTSRYSAQFLDLANKNGLKVNLIVSAPPKPTGRQQILTENPTVAAAKALKIPFVTSLSDLPKTIQQFNNITIEKLNHQTIGLMLDFNRLVPKNIIDTFNKGIINIHFSKLPQYRGPAPVQYTILNGDKEAWITYYLINERVDAGQILAQTSLPLDLTENTETLYQKLIKKSSLEIVDIIDDYLSDRVQPCQQADEASYTQKLKTENCQIDWTKSPEQIERLIRAAFPEPGAWSLVQIPSRKRLRIIKAHLESGKLILETVHLEGKKPVTWQQFQQGYPSASLS